MRPAHQARWRLRGVAIAASFLLLGLSALAVYSFLGPNRASKSQGLSELLPSDAHEQAATFASVSELFDGRAGWVALSDGDFKLGLTQRPVSAPGKLVLVRLTLSNKNAVVSQIDLSILPGQKVVLQSPFDTQRTLSYQLNISRESPNKLALWAELQPSTEAGEVLGAVATNLSLRADQISDAGRLSTGAEGYELMVGCREVDWKGTY